MSAKPETTFYASVHKHLEPANSFHREKMSNPYRGGTADHWYDGDYDLWIEWKFLVLPKRDDTVIDFVSGKKPIIGTLQQDWIERRLANGRSVWVGVGCKVGGVLFKTDEWKLPISTGSFRKRLINREEIARQITNHCYP